MQAEDDGFTAHGLRGIAWALGVLAGISWFAAASLMSHPHPISRDLGLWLGVAAMSTVFSAACAVLCGVKGVADRSLVRTEHDHS